MLTIYLTLLILAAVSFFLAAFDVKFGRISFLPTGLFLWVLAIILRQT